MGIKEVLDLLPADEESLILATIPQTVNDERKKLMQARVALETLWLGNGDRELYDAFQNLPYDMLHLEAVIAAEPGQTAVRTNLKAARRILEDIKRRGRGVTRWPVVADGYPRRRWRRFFRAGLLQLARRFSGLRQRRVPVPNGFMDSGSKGASGERITPGRIPRAANDNTTRGKRSRPFQRQGSRASPDGPVARLL